MEGMTFRAPHSSSPFSSRFNFSGASDGVLDFFSQVSLRQESPLNSAQAVYDGMIGGFVEESTNWRSLTAMAAGGFAFRMGRFAVLSFGGASSAAPILNLASRAVGLASEVTVFEGVGEVLRPGSSASIEREGEFWNRWRTSFVQFGLLKWGGAAAMGQNRIVQHFLQDAAMVGGHRITAELGWTPSPEGGLARQFLHAEATNWEMTVGMSVAHSLLPGISRWERSIELSSESALFSMERGGGLVRGARFPLLQRLFSARALLPFLTGCCLAGCELPASGHWGEVLFSVLAGVGVLGMVGARESRTRLPEEVERFLEALQQDDKATDKELQEEMVSRLTQEEVEEFSLRIERLFGSVSFENQLACMGALSNLFPRLSEARKGAQREWLIQSFSEPVSDQKCLTLQLLFDRSIRDFDTEQSNALMRRLIRQNPEGLHRIGRRVNAELFFIFPMHTRGIGVFDVSTRVSAVKQILEEHSLEDLPLSLLSLFLESLPKHVLRDLGSSHENETLRVFSHFYDSNLPLDLPGLWQEYLRAEDRQIWVERLRERSRPYRHGKEVDFDDPESLRLAYVAMDRPSAAQDTFGNPVFNWELFQKKMASSRDAVLPEPLLEGSFSFSVSREGKIHETLDKGGLSEEVGRVLESEEIPGLRERVIRLLVSPPKPWRQVFRRYLVERHGFRADADLTQTGEQETLRRLMNGAEETLERIKELLPLMAPAVEKGASYAIEPVSRLLLALSYHRSGAESARGRLRDFKELQDKGQAVAPETLVETLDSLLFLHQDSLSETLQELRMTSPSFLDRRKEWLQGQRRRVHYQAGPSSRVEVLFSRSRIDQFFGYVGEDCTKGKGEEIANPSFQPVRLLVDGVWEGSLYLHEARRADESAQRTERALVFALAPRQRLNVSAQELLRGAAEGLSAIARERGYDYVLFPAADNEQGNRADVGVAVSNAGYPQIPFLVEDSKLFHSGDFYVVWDGRAERENVSGPER